MKALLMIGAIALANSPALAKTLLVDADAPRVERIGTADLDLASAAGVRRLEGRINAAARTLCVEDGVQSLSIRLARRACFDDAVADGLAQASRLIEAERSGAAIAAASVIVRAR